MSRVLSDDRFTHQHERRKTETTFPDNTGAVRTDGGAQRTWHLASASQQPVMTAANDLLDKCHRQKSQFALSKYKEKQTVWTRTRQYKHNRRYSYSPPNVREAYDTSSGTAKVANPTQSFRQQFPQAGQGKEYTNQRNEFVGRRRFLSTDFKRTRSYRDHLNQNSEGNSDTSESDIGLIPGNNPSYDRGCDFGARNSTYGPKPLNDRTDSRTLTSDPNVQGDIFTANANLIHTEAATKKTSKQLDKKISDVKVDKIDRKLFETAATSSVSLDEKADRVGANITRVQCFANSDSHQGKGSVKKFKRPRKIYVNGLWIPVRCSKDIQQLFSTEPVVVLDRITTSTHDRLAKPSARRINMSILDPSEARVEMDENIDKLKQNISENILESCELPMDLTNYSIGDPDKLFEVDQSLPFNIDKFRKACQAFRNRESNTGRDPVLSGYQSDEEEKLQSEEPEYVYFGGPTDNDEVFRDPFDINAFSEDGNILDLQDTTQRDEDLSGDRSKDNIQTSVRISDIGNTDSEKHVSTPEHVQVTNALTKDANSDKVITLIESAHEEVKQAELNSCQVAQEQIIYHKNDHHPQCADQAQPKSPQLPPNFSCSTGQTSEAVSKQVPQTIQTDDSVRDNLVRSFREDGYTSPVQTGVMLKCDLVPKVTASTDAKPTPHIVSSTPVTASGETVIIEEISLPQNAVLVSGSQDLSTVKISSKDVSKTNKELTNNLNEYACAVNKESLETKSRTVADANEDVVGPITIQSSAREDDRIDVGPIKDRKGQGVPKIVRDDFQMDIESDEPYPLSMVVVNRSLGARTDDSQDTSMRFSECLNSGPKQSLEEHEDDDYDEVYDLSTVIEKTNGFSIDNGVLGASTSPNGDTSEMFEASFPYNFQIASSVASASDQNNLMLPSELDAIERMTNANLSDDEVFPRLVINEENSNIGSEPTSDLVIDNVISLKNNADVFLTQDFNVKDFNIDASLVDNKELNYQDDPSQSELNNDKCFEIVQGNVDEIKALDMTSSFGKSDDHAERNLTSPESMRSDGSLKCVLTKQSDTGAKVRYVIKSLSSVDSDDPAPFFTLSRDERGDPREPLSPNGECLDDTVEFHEVTKKPIELDQGIVTREQAIRTCSALADVSPIAKTLASVPVSPIEHRKMHTDHTKVQKSHKKTKRARDLKRVAPKIRSNSGFLTRPSIRKNRISSSLKQFNTRSKSQILALKASSTQSDQRRNKSAKKVGVKCERHPSRAGAHSDMSSDLSDLGEQVENAMLEKGPIKKRKLRLKKDEDDSNPSGERRQDGATAGTKVPKRDNHTEGDDLPEILPPKRRRVRNPPNVHAHEIEESEVLSRLSQEFPKHNWLENKIKHNQDEGHKVVPSPQEPEKKVAELTADSSAKAADFSQRNIAVKHTLDMNKVDGTTQPNADITHSGLQNTDLVNSRDNYNDIGKTKLMQQPTSFSKTSGDLTIATDAGRTEQGSLVVNFNFAETTEQYSKDSNRIVGHQMGPNRAFDNQVEEQQKQEFPMVSHDSKYAPVQPGDQNLKSMFPLRVRLAGSGDHIRQGELSMKDTLEEMIEARLLEDFRVGSTAVDLTLSQTSAEERDTVDAASDGANSADRTGNYWSVSATNFNLRGPQQRTTKHSTPVLRVQPLIKSNHEKSESASTQIEAISCIKMQMSTMDETSTSASGQRSVSSHDSHREVNTVLSTASVGTTSSGIPAALGGPISIVPPIQTIQPKPSPNQQRPTVPHTHPQAMGVHRSAQILFQQAQSVVMKQQHFAQNQQMPRPLSIPQNPPSLAPRLMIPYQQRPMFVQQPSPQNLNINTQQNQVVRAALPSPKTPGSLTPQTPGTPGMINQPAFPYQPVSSGASTIPTPVTTPSTNTVVPDKQGKSIGPMTPSTFVREYQKMKREFQRIEAMLTIKERERKQLLFMKSRMSLLIDKMENKLRSLPVNFSSKLISMLPNATKMPQIGVDSVGNTATDLPPQAHVKEPLTDTIQIPPGPKSAHSDKISTVPRHLIFMDKVQTTKEVGFVQNTSDQLPKPAHAQSVSTPNVGHSINSDYKPKEGDDRSNPSPWKNYANSLRQEGCSVHPYPSKEDEQKNQGLILHPKRNQVEVIDLTREAPAVLGRERQNNHDDTRLFSQKENYKEQKVQALLHDVQAKRSTVCVPGTNYAVAATKECSPAVPQETPVQFSQNAVGPPALVPVNMPQATTPQGNGMQQTIRGTVPAQRPITSRCSPSIPGSSLSHGGQAKQSMGLGPQLTAGNDLSPGLSRLSGYNPPYSNPSFTETIRVRNPMEHSPGRTSQEYSNAKSNVAVSRQQTSYPSSTPSTGTMFGLTSMAGQPTAYQVPSSPSMTNKQPSSHSTPPTNTLERSRSNYSSASSPMTPNNPGPPVSPLRQTSAGPSPSPVRDPTRRPSFPGAPVQCVDLATSTCAPVSMNTSIHDQEIADHKLKMKKRAPKRYPVTQMPQTQPHPMVMQHNQFYRGTSPMMAQLSMHGQAPRLLGPEQRPPVPQDMYGMPHQSDMMPGMIQMTPRAQMMHQVRPPGPPKPHGIGYSDQATSMAMQDPVNVYRQREYAAQQQRMMQTTIPRMQAARHPMPGQQMMMPPQPQQLSQYQMQMPSIMPMEQQRGGRDISHAMGGSRDVAPPMGPPREVMPPTMYPADSLCVVCNQRAAFLCSGCKRMWYCSERCQAKSWQLNHKLECPAAVPQ